MNRSLTVFRNKFDNVGQSAKSLAAKVGKGVAGFGAFVMSAAAAAQGATIASEIAGGETQMGLVFAAVAVLIGLLLVWSYIRRSAK